MNQLKQEPEFAKVFNFDKGQLLILKHFTLDFNANSPFELRILTQYSSNSDQLLPEMVIAFPNATDRNIKFNSIDQEQADSFFSDLNKVADNYINDN